MKIHAKIRQSIWLIPACLMCLWTAGCAEGVDDETDTDYIINIDTNRFTGTESDTSTAANTDTASGTGTETGAFTPGTESDSATASETEYEIDTEHWFIDTDPPFEDSILHTFHITVSQENLAWLEANATLEEYVSATVSFDDTPMGEVGIRYKGASSLHHCFDDAGVRIDNDRCRKLSIKIRFDEYVDATRLFGLKRINLHAMQADYSKLKERLAYKLFRANNVPASRAGHARVILNGVYAGLFAMVEQVDGRFTADRWPDAGDGNLYKESWWTELYENGWIEDLRTNEDSPDVSEALALATAIQQSNVDTFVETVVPFFEIEHFLRYMVVDRAITNVDGITRFYAEDERTEPNTGFTKNFYIYQQEPGGKFVMVPWDMDLTLNYPDDFMDVAGVPDWNRIPADCYTNYLVWDGNSYTKPPGCNHFHAMVVQNYWEDFVVAGHAFLGGPFQLANMMADVNRWEAQIKEALLADPNIVESDWKWGLDKLKDDLPFLITRFENFLNEGLTVE